MDNIRHKEGYRREVMHAAFEAPVSCSKNKWADSILRLGLVTVMNSLMRQNMSNIVCIHQALLQSLVSLPYTLAIVLIESSQSVDLVVQMLTQRLRKRFDEALDLLPVIVFWRTCLGVLVKRIESWRECSVLFYVAFHDSLDACYLLYAREEVLLFHIVVMVHRFRPALTICQEVSDCV